MRNAFVLVLGVMLSAIVFSPSPDPAAAGWPKECTSVLAGKNTTADGSVMHGYSCDGADYCYLSYTPGEEHRNESYAVLSFDGRKLGEVPQAERTYAVWSAMVGIDHDLPSGGLNEHGVSIAETTIPGRETLFSDRCVMEYQNLMYLTLQRSRSAGEAIAVMSGLVDEYGFNMADGGECITVADPEEAWVFEVFGPGAGWTPESGEPGAVWVARRVGDDEVFVSANRARIGEIRSEDMTSSNVYSLAKELGLWDGRDEFVWQDVYGEDQGRYSSLREWRVFSLLAPSERLSPDAVRYPFSVEPDRRIGVKDLMGVYRDAYEGTPFDLTENPAFYVNGTKSPIASPYGRNNTRDDLWDLLGIESERTISQSRTGFSFINQLRSNGLSVMWFANDCPGTSVYVPVYAEASRMPEKWLRCNDTTVDDSAWWTFNLVNNLAFQSRYQYAIGDIQQIQRSVEDGFLAQQKATENTALRLEGKARNDFLERYTYKCADEALRAYEALTRELIYRYYSF
jgi:dipeptidase